MTKGILPDPAQARARQMLRAIGDKQKETDKKEPWMSTLDRVELRRFWVLKRNFTDIEFDLIKQVHGRIKK